MKLKSWSEDINCLVHNPKDDKALVNYFMTSKEPRFSKRGSLLAGFKVWLRIL